MPITPKQQRILSFITGYIDSNQNAPTIAEIGRHFQMRSSASVHQVLIALEREGFIKRTPNVSRGIQVVAASNDVNCRTCGVKGVGIKPGGPDYQPECLECFTKRTAKA